MVMYGWSVTGPENGIVLKSPVSESHMGMNMSVM